MAVRPCVVAAAAEAPFSCVYSSRRWKRPLHINETNQHAPDRSITGQTGAETRRMFVELDKRAGAHLGADRVAGFGNF